jgi:hypothetical protein
VVLEHLGLGPVEHRRNRQDLRLALHRDPVELDDGVCV